MQITNTICDICFDAGNPGVPGFTMDLSWLRPGFEVDICDQHLAELEAERNKLADAWLKSARRMITGKKQPTPTSSATNATVVPGHGVEGVDWVWSRNRTRRQKVISEKCPSCDRVFTTKASYSQHVRTHDPSVRSTLVNQLESAHPEKEPEAQGGLNEHADTHAM